MATSTRARPLSPFMNYRFMYTMVLSFAHRVTGVFLSVGLLMLVCWLLALAGGPERYAAIMAFLGRGVMKLLLLGWLFSFFFHLCNGLRHLAWDCGVGYEKRQARTSGWIVALAALALTALCAWLIVSRAGGVS